MCHNCLRFCVPRLSYRGQRSVPSLQKRIDVSLSTSRRAESAEPDSADSSSFSIAPVDTRTAAGKQNGQQNTVLCCAERTAECRSGAADPNAARCGGRSQADLAQRVCVPPPANRCGCAEIASVITQLRRRPAWRDVERTGAAGGGWGRREDLEAEGAPVDARRSPRPDLPCPVPTVGRRSACQEAPVSGARASCVCQQRACQCAWPADPAAVNSWLRLSHHGLLWSVSGLRSAGVTCRAVSVHSTTGCHSTSGVNPKHLILNTFS